MKKITFPNFFVMLCRPGIAIAVDWHHATMRKLVTAGSVCFAGGVTMMGHKPPRVSSNHFYPGKLNQVTLVGIELKRPSFWPLTQAVAIATGLWLLLTVSPLGAKDAVTAGGNFAAICFGCVSNVIGIEVKRGGRHLALNIAGCAMVLAAYHAVAAFF